MGYEAALAAVGLVSGGFGALLQGNANEIARKRFQKAVDLPGLDVGAATDEALGTQEKYFDRASSLSDRDAAASQARLLAQEEAALPGVGAARGEALGRIRGLFSDDADWLRGVQRRGAALGLSSGLFGSQAGQLQTLRLSDRESQQRTQLGTNLLGSLVGSLRLSPYEGTRTFLGLTTSQQVLNRANERRDRQDLMAKGALMPGKTQAWADYLGATGGALTGAGLTGGFGGGGGQGSNLATSYTGSSGLGYA